MSVPQLSDRAVERMNARTNRGVVVFAALVVAVGLLALHVGGLGHGGTMAMPNAPLAATNHNAGGAGNVEAQGEMTATSSTSDMVAVCAAILTLGAGLLAWAQSARRHARVPVCSLSSRAAFRLVSRSWAGRAPPLVVPLRR